MYKLFTDFASVFLTSMKKNEERYISRADFFVSHEVKSERKNLNILFRILLYIKERIHKIFKYSSCAFIESKKKHVAFYLKNWMLETISRATVLFAKNNISFSLVFGLRERSRLINPWTPCTNVPMYLCSMFTNNLWVPFHLWSSVSLPHVT